MKFITPVEVTPGSTGWTDVDVTAHVGADAGNIAGVILQIHATLTTPEYNWGVRKNGSTDTLTRIIEDTSFTIVTVGVDASDIFECNVDNITNIDVYLLGYVTNEEATFLTNAVEYSVPDGNHDAWTDIDISASVTAGERAYLAFLLIDQGVTSGQTFWGLRKNGSTDSRVGFSSTGYNDLRGACVGLDSNEIFEGYISETDLNFWLLGYMKKGIVAFTNGVNYATGTTGSYQNVDFSANIPSGNTIAFYQFYEAAEAMAAIRPNGSARDIYADVPSQQWGFTDMDGSRVAQQKIETVDVDLYLMGYSFDPVADRTLSVNDTITITESVSFAYIIDPSISVFDAITITESVSFVYPPERYADDTITISENISIFSIKSGVHVFIGGLATSDEVTNAVYPDALGIDNILTSQSDSCNFTLRKYGAYTSEPIVGQEVFIYIDGVREFGGIISRVTQRAENYKIILFDVQCEDYTRLANKKLVTGIFQNQTVGYILQSLNSRFLNGFTLLQVDNAETEVAYIAFNYESVSSSITKLANLLNYDWYIDYYKNIYFISKTSQTAPFDIFDSDDSYIFDSFRLRRDNSQVRNRVFVAGGEYLGDTFTTEFESDGVQNVYTLPYKYDDIEVSVTGAVWDGGLDGIDAQSLFDYLWNKNEKFIRFRGDRVPNASSAIRVAGLPYLPVRVVVQDDDSIADFVTAEGGDGIYEHIIIDDTINSQDGARERAVAELESYKATLSEGSFITKRQGLRSGQRILINSTAHGINEYFLINAVRMRMRNNIEPRYEVSLVTTKTLGIIEFLQGLLVVNKKITIQQGDIIDLIKSQSESISIAETVTAQSLNYPVEFVAGPLSQPTGYKRLFITNGSPTGSGLAPQFHEEMAITESVTVTRT